MKLLRLKRKWWYAGMLVFVIMIPRYASAVDSCCSYSSPDNPFGCCGDKGNCTWWCYYKRPDGPDHGDAYEWLDVAVDMDLNTSSTPVVGAIAVWEYYPGSPDCDGHNCGHVAYVEAVYPDGSFGVSEMAYCGWAGGGCVRNHTYAAGSSSGFILPPGTARTSWGFDIDGNTEGWIAYNVYEQVVSASVWTVNPDNDPRLVSPLLDRTPLSINYLKIGVKNKGGDDQGQVFFSAPEYSYAESRKASFSNPNNDFYNWITVRLDNIPDWSSGSNLDHIRIDPVLNGVPVNGNDDVMIDYIFLRMDATNPSSPTIAPPSPPSWTNGSITVSFQSNDPADVNAVGPDVYGSGISQFMYRVDPQADQVKLPDSFDDRTGLASASVTYTPGQLAQGANSFHVYCFDRIDHVSVDSQATLYFDSVAPTASRTGGAAPGTYTTDQTIYFGISDGTSGTKGFSVGWDNPDVPGPTVLSSSGSTTLGAAGPGTHTLYVRAWDNANNNAATDLGVYTYNPPTCESDPNLSFDTPSGSIPCGWSVVNLNGAGYGYATGGAPGGGTRYVSFTHSDGDDWNAIGRSATSVGLVPDGPYYRLGFWYRASTTSTSFSWRLGDSGLTSSSEYLVPSITPASAGGWTWYASPPFHVTSSQLAVHPMLTLYFDYGAMGTVDIDNVQLVTDTGCGIVMVGSCQ